MGAAMTVAALLLWPMMPVTAVVVAAAGNALYHVGAGGACLKLARYRAAMGGVFVGPGGLGVVLGVFLGMEKWPGIAALIAANAVVAGLAGLWCWKRQQPTETMPSIGGGRRAAIIALLVVALAARQLVGGAVGGPWLSQPAAWIALACCAMVGKMIFGFVADALGWMRTVVPLVVVAALLLPVAGGHWGVAAAATFLVQAAMPVTLAAMSCVLPGRPALAFGAASSALWLGALPAMVSHVPGAVVWAAQGGSAVAIAGALWLLAREWRGSSSAWYPPPAWPATR